MDINLKCSGYKFCHLENSLAGFQYVFFFVLVSALYPMWILFSLKLFFSFRNYTIAMVFLFSLYCGIFIVIVSLFSLKNYVLVL